MESPQGRPNRRRRLLRFLRFRIQIRSRRKRRLSMSNTALRKLFLAATVTCTLAIPAAAEGMGRYVQVEYPASAAPGELQVG